MAAIVAARGPRGIHLASAGVEVRPCSVEEAVTLLKGPLSSTHGYAAMWVVALASGSALAYFSSAGAGNTWSGNVWDNGSVLTP